MKGKFVASSLALALTACSADSPGPTDLELRVPLFANGSSPRWHHATTLSGAEEVFTPANPGDPTPAQSPARGEAVFRVNKNGTHVVFRLFANNISNVTMAHIHCGPSGVNGPAVMWLYPVIGPTGAPGPDGAGPHAGLLAKGEFSPVGVMCPASAVGTEMTLLEAMRAGLVYVNVHTSDGVGAPNTGPGDFPGGEIRGQVD